MTALPIRVVGGFEGLGEDFNEENNKPQTTPGLFSNLKAKYEAPADDNRPNLVQPNNTQEDSKEQKATTGNYPNITDLLKNKTGKKNVKFSVTDDIENISNNNLNDDQVNFNKKKRLKFKKQNKDLKDWEIKGYNIKYSDQTDIDNTKINKGLSRNETTANERFNAEYDDTDWKTIRRHFKSTSSKAVINSTNIEGIFVTKK